MARWTKGPNGYARVVEQAPTPEAKAALEGNESFQKGEAFQRGEAEGAPQSAPAAFVFHVTIGEDLLKAYERLHHADLRGVGLDERLDRINALIETNNPEYTELVELMFKSHTEVVATAAQ